MKKAYLFALTTVFLWATCAPFVKWLLGGLPNLEALTISAAFAALSLFLLNLFSGRLKRLRTYPPKAILTMVGLGFLGLFLYDALYYYGISQLSAQEACILNYLWPIMIVLFSVPVLKEKLTPMTMVSLGCSFAGIVILSLGGEAGGGNRTLGIAACILAAACYGLFSVLNKKINFDQNLTMMILWLTVAVCSAALGLGTESWVPVHGMQWAGLLWIGAVANAVGYLLWALVLNSAEDSALIANLSYLTPFLSVILCGVFLKEEIQARAVAALILIVGGILLQSLHSQHKRKAAKA